MLELDPERVPELENIEVLEREAVAVRLTGVGTWNASSALSLARGRPLGQRRP
jgi:hypothetical protein